MSRGWERFTLRRSLVDIVLLPLSDISSHVSSATCSLDLRYKEHMKDVDAAAAIMMFVGNKAREGAANGKGVKTSTGFFMFMSAKPLSTCGESPSTAQSA